MLGIYPKLAVILIGDDRASKIYVSNKNKACKYIGIQFDEYLLDSSITQNELLSLIDNLNNDTTISGILLQSPIPKGLNINEIIQRISPKKDVDGFNPVNIGKLILGQDTFIPCTPHGILKMFDEYKIDLNGKNVTIIGRSNIVGKPLIQCCLNRNATVTICHSKTKDIKQHTLSSDVIISAVGIPNFLTEDMVRENGIIIDVGINRMDDGKLVGDVDFKNIYKKASYITPVPNGVGKMTVAMLMSNVIQAATENTNRDSK